MQDFAQNYLKTAFNPLVKKDTAQPTASAVQPYNPTPAPVAPAPVPVPNKIPADVVTYNAPQNPIITSPFNGEQKKLDALSGSVMTTPAPQAPVVSDRDMAINDRQKAIDLYLDPSKGYSATEQKLTQDSGVNESQGKLNALNVRDIALQKRQMDMENDILNKNQQGLFGGGAQQLINQNQRDISSERANLAIEKLALQGDISTAQALIKNKLDAQFEPMKDRIAYIEKTLDIYDKDLSESQKQQFEMEKYQLQEQAKQKESFQKIIDEAGTGGAPVEVQNEASNLFAQGNRAGAIALLSQYSKRAQGEQLTPYQRLQATQSIAKDVQMRTANAREISRQAKLITDSYNNILNGGDRSLNTQAIVTSFNKILDPTSVVRESEFDRTAKGQSLLERLRGKADAIATGGAGVTQETLKEASDIASEYLRNSSESIQQENQRALQLADEFGLTGSSVTSSGYQDEEIKEVKGVKYKKVPGGWQQVLTSVGSDTKKAPGKEIVAGYDITSYATDPTHGQKIEKIYSRIPNVATVNDIDSYIKKVAPKSPVSGIDVARASDKYGVDPKLVIAMMVQDSSLGTAGKAVRTRNPGNVGNDDTGALRTYATWSEGVEAVAKNLAWRKLNKTA